MLTFSTLSIGIGIGFLVYVVQACRLSAARRKLKQTQREALLVCQQALARDLKRLHDVLSTMDGMPSFLPLQVEWRMLNKQALHLGWLGCEDHFKMEEMCFLQTDVSDLWQRVMEQQLPSYSKESGLTRLFL